eukprot:TRINITY_DN914_c0_g1_i1.p1 TRINITY_DN914_c0_g1~~TRINITY_DN914_c0_g1_i1.p1  ORF type:complete len:527 (-),score=193.59 TRINITY_DN914_c0_g1_i1:242-1822(-)
MSSTVAPSKAPPPPPPRGSSTANLSAVEEESNQHQHVEGEENGNENYQQEEYFEEEIPTEVYNGDYLEAQTVAPNRYRHYTVTVEGEEEDIVDLKVSKLVHAATANIYVNTPSRESFPTADDFSWNPTKGPLLGPPGVYKIAIHGVPSFIEKDDMWLVDPSANWSTFDLSVSWNLLDEQTKTKMKAISDQYKREKASMTWKQGYQDEMLDKYSKESQQSEQELAERLSQLETQNSQEINVDGTEFSKQFELGAVLGSSNGFSVVRKAKEKSSGKEFAVKLIDKSRANVDGITSEDLNRQVKVFKHFGTNENVVQLVKDLDSSNLLVLVMELLDGVPADRFVATSANYSEDVARNVVKQVLNGLKDLHAKKVVHKSVVPGNVVVSKDGKNAKLVGFTLSDFSSGNDQTLSGGNPAYQAPEVITRQPFGVAVDLWAAGCLTYFLLSGSPPFVDTNNARLNLKIKQGKFEFNPNFESVSAEAKQFVSSLLVVNPAERPNAETALKHAWFSKTGGNQLPNAVANAKKSLD